MDVNDFLPPSPGVLLLGDLHSHCILVLLSLNLQAAHSSTLLEYLFTFLFPSFVLCGVSVLCFYQAGIKLGSLCMLDWRCPRDTAPGLFHFYFIILFIILSVLAS